MKATLSHHSNASNNQSNPEFSEEENLNILIGILAELIGIKNHDIAHSLAREIVYLCHSLDCLLNLRESDLMTLKGIGPVRSTRLVAGLRLARYFNAR